MSGTLSVPGYALTASFLEKRSHITWTLETFKRLVVKSNDSTEEEIFWMREKAKGIIKELKISTVRINTKRILTRKHSSLKTVC